MAHRRPARRFSARFPTDVVDALERHNVRTGQSKIQVAERLIDEGLQVDQAASRLQRVLGAASAGG
jgi:hypothetical protein